MKMLNQEGLTITDQEDFSTDLVIPISGWVPNIEPGKKCKHGVYIPSTQEFQWFAENCQVCTGLRDYLSKTGKTLEEANARVKFLWNRLDKKEEQ
jgi:hypothetical protein